MQRDNQALIMPAQPSPLAWYRGPDDEIAGRSIVEETTGRGELRCKDQPSSLFVSDY